MQSIRIHRLRFFIFSTSTILIRKQNYLHNQLFSISQHRGRKKPHLSKRCSTLCETHSRKSAWYWIQFRSWKWHMQLSGASFRNFTLLFLCWVSSGRRRAALPFYGKTPYGPRDVATFRLIKYEFSKKLANIPRPNFQRVGLAIKFKVSETFNDEYS